MVIVDFNLPHKLLFLFAKNSLISQTIAVQVLIEGYIFKHLYINLRYSQVS